jgi:hypothetical protein
MRTLRPAALWMVWTLAAQSALAQPVSQPTASQPPASQPADVRFGPPAGTNTIFQPASYPDRASWEARRAWLREQVKLAAGLVPEPRRGMLDAHIFGKLVRDGYTIEKVYFTSTPGLYVTGNLYRPTEAAGKCPGIACPHGHWKNGRIHHDPELGSIPARCITLARAGAVVFAYDMVGYNDSAQSFKHRDERLDTPETALWGIGHFQLQTLNSIRVIDFLQSLPDVDPKRIGVTGASGGGTQTFILGALDDRVTADCPVNMISSTMQGGCVCENAPCLRIDTNNMEIGAIFAPRPRLMVSATGDWTKLTPQVEFPFTRGIYDLFKAGDRISNVHIDAPHNYNRASREAMYAFFGKYLLNRDDIHEGDIQIEAPEAMLVFADKARVPADWPTVEQVIARKQSETRLLIEPYHPTSAARLQSLSQLVGHTLRHAVDCDTVFPRVVSTRLVKSQPTQQVETLLQRNGRLVQTMSFITPQASRTGKWAVIVDPAGVAATEKYSGAIAALLSAGRCVLIAEPFTTGKNWRPPSSAKPEPFFTTFNRTDVAEAVFDITSAVVATAEGLVDLERNRAKQVDLIGAGRMGPVCVLARAMLPQLTHVPMGLVADMNGFDTNRDDAYVKELFVPCIQRIGGVPAIAAVAASGPTWLHNTAGRLDTRWIDEAKALTNVAVRVDDEAANIDAIVAWLTR